MPSGDQVPTGNEELAGSLGLSPSSPWKCHVILNHQRTLELCLPSGDGPK